MPRTVDTYLHLPRRRYFSALELAMLVANRLDRGDRRVCRLRIQRRAGPDAILPGYPTMKLRTATVLMALSMKLPPVAARNDSLRAGARSASQLSPSRC